MEDSEIENPRPDIVLIIAQDRMDHLRKRAQAAERRLFVLSVIVMPAVLAYTLVDVALHIWGRP